MLDALLEWCMSRHVGQDFGLAHALDERRASYEPGLIPIPVARRRVEGFAWPIPLCSSPIFRARRDGVEHFARRFDPDPALIAGAERKVYASNSGEFKSYRLPLRVRLVEKIAWFAVGDRKEVRRLLRDVYSLGKKSSQGHGRIASWEVEHWEGREDWCWLAPSESGPVLMRSLPLTVVPDGVLGARRFFGGLVSPYWASEFFSEGVIPC